MSQFNNNNNDIMSFTNTQCNICIQGPYYINHNHDDTIVTLL